jgi:DNA-binding NtrC family response regulator
MNGYLENNNADESALSREKILVMDHDEVMRDAAGIMLHFLGYACNFARNGEEAFRFYRMAWETNQPYTAVILDSNTPGEQGVENILQALLNVNPQVKAIIAGGDVHHPLLTEYRTHGFSGAVIRPYTIDDLKAVLCQLPP